MAWTNWTEEETLMAFALHFILLSGSHHKNNADIKRKGTPKNG